MKIQVKGVGSCDKTWAEIDHFDVTEFGVVLVPKSGRWARFQGFSPGAIAMLIRGARWNDVPVKRVGTVMTADFRYQ